MIDLLAKPVVDLLGAFGSGMVPPGGPTEVIRASSSVLDSVQQIGRAAVSELASSWSGPAATAAIDLAERTHSSAVALSDHGSDIAAIVDRACEKVHAGLVELQAIVQSFLSVATAAAPMLWTPAGQSMIIAAAIEHLQRALAVVARVRAELAAHAAEIGAFGAAPSVPESGAPAPHTTPASVVSASPAADPGAAFAQNFARTISASAPNFAEPGAQATSPAAVTNAGQTGFKDGMSTFAGAPPRSAAPVGGPDAAAQGGVQVTLPDGSVAVAPNEQAAGAVRSALTQQGTPYSWGGTEPGRGLDCSGLTQWAYREQGVELPRLAQEQNVGTQVSRDEVLPGDLAVWDGHVAMVVGNNQLVEAGDPVQVGDIRTTNSGMAFMGFYRPTA